MKKIILIICLINLFIKPVNATNQLHEKKKYMKEQLKKFII